jgi:hypothetical protein
MGRRGAIISPSIPASGESVGFSEISWDESTIHDNVSRWEMAQFVTPR